MTLSKLGSLALAGAVAFCCVPACGDDDSEDSAFAGAAGSSGAGRGGNTSRGGNSGSGGRGGTTAGKGGGAGQSSSGGDGSGSGGEPSLGGNGGSAEAGGTSLGGAPSGSGGSGDPGVGWYCNLSPSGCVCVQEPLEYGDCGLWSCCYTYDSGASGLACACNDEMDTACEAEVANYDGTRVDFCPP